MLFFRARGVARSRVRARTRTRAIHACTHAEPACIHACSRMEAGNKSETSQGPACLGLPRFLGNGTSETAFLKPVSKALETGPDNAIEPDPEIASGTGTVNFHDPPGPARVTRARPTLPLRGWRAGRNPPSVQSSIRLIGEPAPQAELTGVYIPFHSAAGARFTLPSSPPSRHPEASIIVTRY